MIWPLPSGPRSSGRSNRGTLCAGSHRRAAGGRRTAIDSLSRREHEVLIQLAKGLTNREIADALFIAEQTVKNHVSEIYAKLGVHDRAQALLLALEAGIE